MTAPTQGKERGAASATRGPFPPASRPFPCSLPRPRSLRAPASRAPRRAQPSPPFPRGLPAAPHRLRIWHLTLPRSRSSCRVLPLLARTRGLGCCGTRERTPRLGAEGAGRKRTPLFQGPQRHSWGPLSARLPGGALPRTRVPPRGPGHPRGCSEAPGGVSWAEGGRDPARQGSGSGKTRFG